MTTFEQVLEFLRPFAEGEDGYIGFTKANRSQEEHDHNPCALVKTNCPNGKWSNFHNWFAECAGGQVDLSEEILTEHSDWEFYFTPAVLTTESRLQSKFKHSNVIWIDFDEEVNWQAFDPAPSIVVQTSDKKFHCYWLLNWRISNVNDMRYWCKRFLEYFGNASGDKSGFDATQLLKLPYGKNLKIDSRNMDGTPFSPKLVKFATDLRYSEVAFEHIPEPTVEVDLTAIPDMPESTGGWQHYLELNRSAIPQAVQDRISTFQEGGIEKRSGVLYNLQCELFDCLDTPDDIFLVLLGSPNDKFTADYGPRGSVLLWKDVNRVAVKMQRSKATPVVAKGLRDILENKDLSPSQKVVNATGYVMESLRETGGFVRTTRGEAYYVDQRAEAVTLHEVNVDRISPFSSMVRRRFGLNEGAHKGTITGLLHEAVDECLQENPVSFHHFGYYDEERNKVYVDRYDGYMYVLNGEKITLEPHGYDRVYFYQSSGEFPRPFEYNTEYQPGGLDAIILDGPNFTTQNSGVSRKELRHLLKTWVASFFFPTRMSTKPIVLIHGAADSGKTTLFQNLSIMFTGDSTFSVTEMPKDAKEFNVQVTQSSYIFYDNVEVNKKEMQEKLAQAATGFTVKNRKLFTNNEMTSEKARCFLGITSRTLDKIQEDVAQRYLLIPVHPFNSGDTDDNMRRRSMSEILKEVMAKRDVLWSELLDFVNSMVKEIDQHGWPESGSRMRMADYADVLDITCGIVGLSSRKIEKFIMGGQAEIVNENDPMFEGLRKLLANPTHEAERKYTAKELQEVITRMHRKIAIQYNTSNKFSRQLKAYVYNGQLERAGIRVKMHQSGNNTLFSVEEVNLTD